MMRRTGIFSQLLSLIDGNVFQRRVKKHRAGRYPKGFTGRDQPAAMLFRHPAQAENLREICGGLASTPGKVRHLGLKKAPAGATLS